MGGNEGTNLPTGQAKRQLSDRSAPAASDQAILAARPIVVGIDGSRFGVQALRWALAEADRRDCGVLALMVGQEDLYGLEDTIHLVLGEHDNPRLAAQAVSGSAAERLCAASADAQLLVVGSHGRGLLAEAVVGSVARYCVHHASCPVVVIPAELAETTRAASASVARPEARSYAFGPLL
jgi:nucleotide-binding universal stress UspA family protein